MKMNNYSQLNAMLFRFFEEFLIKSVELKHKTIVLSGGGGGGMKIALTERTERWKPREVTNDQQKRHFW